jgi:hypothetical protein
MTRIATIVTGLWLVGCGSGGDFATVGNCNSSVAPCGGAVVGSWKLSQLCSNTADGGVSTADAGVSTGCAGATVDTSNYHIMDTITFSSGSTYQTTGSLSGSERFTIPAQCLTATLTCDALNQSLQQLKQQPDPVFSSGSCAMSGSDCMCMAQFNVTPQSESGTYSTSGTTITTTNSSGNASTSSYCVSGNTLYFFSASGAVTGWFVKE